MRKGIIKAVVLLAVFCITVWAAGTVTHKNNVDMTSKMQEATLPVVCLQQGERQINQLFGYTAEMDGTAVRDTITPLGEDLTLPVTVHTYDNNIESISYQVRTLDMERLIEEKSVEDFSSENGEIKMQLQFQKLLEEGTEYMLVLMVNEKERPVYFYTRIIFGDDYYVQEALDFVTDFHNRTMNKEEAGSLATYLEPDSQADNTTLQRVTINSSLNQVTWGDFQGEVLRAPIPSVKEISSSYNTIVLRYVMTSSSENGAVEYYNIEEYYRVRYANKRMYLLNYERTMNQLFHGEDVEMDANHIILGIRSGDVEYQTNEGGTVIAFVQEGELWSYQKDSNQFLQIYSFREAEGIGDRENNQQHKIKIVKIDESGSMDFVVCGYMNRGTHEGRTGIGVYHYDSVANTVEEEVFLPSDKSYEMLSAEWGKIFYVSDGNMFYLLADNVLYRIDLYSKEVKEVISGLMSGGYAVSDDGRYVAWQEGENIYQAQKLNVMDLEGEEKRSIEAEPNEYIYPVGFVKSDFVYGAAHMEDVQNAGNGENHHFPMYRIRIVNKALEVVKDYQKEGYYISNAYVQNQTIFLDREIWENGTYRTADQDTIKNQEIEADRKIVVETVETSKKQQKQQFTFAEEINPANRTPQVVVPREIVVEEERLVTLEPRKNQEMYYVYSAGKIVKTTHSVSEAIQAADQAMGVVIGEKQEYIWRRGRKRSVPLVGNPAVDTALVSEDSTARCITAMLKIAGTSIDVDDLLSRGETPKQILTGALPEYEVIDLSGCTVEQVLYYVNCNTPVLSFAEDGALLIVGYDEHNTVLYDPVENTTRKMGLQDSSAMFEAAGNVFLGYIE